MSSEAAYFPDALARSAGGRDAALGFGEPAPEVRVEPREEPAVRDVNLEAAEDERLMEQVQDGGKEAFSVLFRRYARPVRNVAYRILCDEAEADDLTQEVFLFIFRKSALYDPAQGKAATWIIHLAYHRAFDRRRYLNTRHFYTVQEFQRDRLPAGDARSQSVLNERSTDRILGRQILERFNRRLTAEQRETIRLHFFEGYEFREIAELTGRSLVNVRSHYYRGLERLRRCLLEEKSGPR